MPQLKEFGQLKLSSSTKVSTVDKLITKNSPKNKQQQQQQ